MDGGGKRFRLHGHLETCAKFCAALLAVLFLQCLLPALAYAQTAFSYGNSADGAFNETTAPCATPFIRTFTVTDNFVVGDLDVGMLLAHTYRGDIQITLQAPAAAGGATVTLFNQTGGNTDNLNILFNDAHANPIANHNANNDTATATTVAPPWEEQTYRPNAVLSGFNGINAQGTWTLRICDTGAGDNGTFYQANLYFTSRPANYADLSLTKTVNTATPSSGASITYSLTVTNAATSPNTAAGIAVRDILPAGVAFVSASGTGSYNSGTGIWTVGSLAPGASATLNIVATVTAGSGATVTNIAEITASSVVDLDSTVNNGVTTEDDYASRAITVAARTAGVPPTISCPVGSNTFDWGVNTWTSGSLNNSYTLAGVGVFNIAMTSTTPYVAGSPAITTQLTGGVAGEVSLFQNLNNTAISDTATTVITMPGGLPGMQFRLFDIDFLAGQFADKVTVTGSYQGSPVAPVLTNGVSNYVTGNVAIGDAAAADASAVGSVVVTFNSPVDTVTIVYGNHTTAPADPGNQWIGLGDLTFCNAYTNYTISKISQVLSDPISATNPKAIPGANVRYCITFSNTGSATMTSVSATDNLPANVTYVPGTLRSGSSCGAATTVEDDNAAGGDETDPFGMNILGTTVTGTAPSLAGSTSFAMTFSVLIN